MDIVVYLFSSGDNMVVAPIGFGELMLCPIDNEEELETIVRIWRSGDLRRSAKMGLLESDRMFIVKQDQAYASYRGRDTPLLHARRGVIRVQKGLRSGWRSYGNILNTMVIPFSPPIEKQSEKPKRIESDKAAITAVPLRWEVLPPGWWRTRGSAIDHRFWTQRRDYEEVERLMFLDSLNPEKWFAGKNYLGERIYYVAVFAGCVVAESASYGNAAYFVFDTRHWQTILSLTKADVLRLGGTVAQRISHSRDWRSRMAATVSRHSPQV